ncbi:MAG TPA: SDR family NAD(P)-dependent oxidoreductase [Candidatus Acidoferrales bacterium]|nr:SDR family NAD(P)-dependent oxidoreductase [Candidatus Acidoferrales bacterium]
MDSKARDSFTCDLHGKTAFVTGGSSGIGAHLAGVLAAAGANVVVAARREQELATVVAAIEKRGGKAFAVRMDVTDSQSIERGFLAAEREVGVANVLLNNAGISVVKPALDVTVEDWDGVISTNLRGPFLVARAFAQRLIAHSSAGSIINVGSIMGARVAGGLTSYAAAKAGLHHLTRALALEWARYGIRVNAIAPGYIMTDMTRDFFSTPPGEAIRKRIPQRCVGELDHLSAPVLLLASDASAYMTGAVVPVDGGHLVSTL